MTQIPEETIQMVDSLINLITAAEEAGRVKQLSAALDQLAETLTAHWADIEKAVR